MTGPVGPPPGGAGVLALLTDGRAEAVVTELVGSGWGGVAVPPTSTAGDAS